MSTYTVVGGGISGLAAAFYLRSLPNVGRIVLLESSNRVGGWIDTTHNPDGVVYEHGPRTVRPAGIPGANTLRLAEQLGLADSVVSVHKEEPPATTRCIYVDGKLHQLPNGVLSLLKTISPFSRPLWIAGLKDLMTKPKICFDDSIYNFVARRFGPEVAEYAVDPMVRGICAGDARKISAKAFVAGPLFELEQEYGGVVKGLIKKAFKSKDAIEEEPPSELVARARREKWSVWSLEGGLSQLSDTLKDRLISDGVEIRLNSRVNSLKQSGSRVNIQLNTSEELSSDHVFLTSPAKASSELTQTLCPPISSLLSSIDFATVAVVNLEYPSRYGIVPFPAFGFLVPSSQKSLPILGCIFDTCSFDQGDRTVLTVMMGGHAFNELYAGKSEAYIERTAIASVQRALNTNAEPCRVMTRVQRDCIPQYGIGHKQRVDEVRRIAQEQRLPVSFAGSSYDGVGLNDAIMSAKKQVMGVVKS